MKKIAMMIFSVALGINVSGNAVAEPELTAQLALTNIAAGKPVAQISTDFGGIPSRAVDGDTNGNYDAGSVTHTAGQGQAGAWWEVDLQQVATIDRISVFNRTDCCGDRLSNFSVQIIDANRAVVKQFVTNGSAARFDYLAGGSKGRYVRVQLNGASVLSLAEVQVWADPALQ